MILRNTKSLNIASYLQSKAKDLPEEVAIICAKKKKKLFRNTFPGLTFKQLNDESDQLAAGLELVGVTRGVRIALMVKPGIEFFTLTFAIFKVGAVLIIIDPGIGLKNMGKCLKNAEVEAFIGIRKAHLARVIMGWGRRTLRINIIAENKLFPGCVTIKKILEKGKKKIPYKICQPDSEEIAAILFTSGSTGPPKGVVYTHGIFIEQVKHLKQMYNIKPGEVDLPTFPLFALFDPALGMTTVIPDMNFSRPAKVNAYKIISTIKKYNVTNMFGSPALINRLGRFGVKKKIKLPSLKRVISAGAPASTVAIKNFSDMLSPGVQIFTPYGATESLPVCSIGSSEILNETASETVKGAGVCVGAPVDGVNLAIIKIVDKPIAVWSGKLLVRQGKIGEIAVKGKVVTKKYYKQEELSRFAKIPLKDSKDFYHRMGDVGYLDKKGRLWFCGRKSHRVVTKNGPLFTIPCEGVFNTHNKVFRTALVGVQKNKYHCPVLCVELENSFLYKNKKPIERELLELASKWHHTREIKTFLFHPDFPVDIRHNSKIFREKLACWAEKQIK